MKRPLCIPVVFAFLLLFFWSCQDEPTAVQSDLTYERGSEGLVMAKPPAGEPLTCKLTVTPHDLLYPVQLPASTAPVTIHWEVSGPNPIAQAYIQIIYDNDKDGVWSVMFSEKVRTINIPCDGIKKSMSGDFPWNGEVDPAHSGSGYLFDQKASGDPDWYLFSFSANDGRNLANNWETTDPYVGPKIPEIARAYVIPTDVTVPEFHIAAITPVATLKKGKYVADLKADIDCRSGGAAAVGFSGRGTWVQVFPGGVEGLPTVYSGCTTCDFKDDNDGLATTGVLSVGAGTYRYYVKLLYSPSYSYAPAGNGVAYGQITVP